MLVSVERPVADGRRSDGGCRKSEENRELVCDELNVNNLITCNICEQFFLFLNFIDLTSILTRAAWYIDIAGVSDVTIGF